MRRKLWFARRITADFIIMPFIGDVWRQRFIYLYGFKFVEMPGNLAGRRQRAEVRLRRFLQEC